MNKNSQILLIDDDPTQIAILTAYFASIGIQDIHSAIDGSQAKNILETQETPFDFIFTDLGMPNTDGFELLKYLGANSFTGKVIIISGHEHILLESASSLGKMYGLAIIGQIRKPLTKQALDRLTAETDTLKTSGVRSNQPTIDPNHISEAIYNREIIPHYQPKVDLLSGRIIGAEALARWIDPQHGVISPATFLPVAEECGLMSQLTMSIFHQTMADYKNNMEAWTGKKISVNLTPDLLQTASLPNTLENMVSEYGLKVSSICIEITESGIIDFDPTVVEVLSRLRIKGFDLSIDDFGTGAANIANLKAFPYNELKIDQSFVNNVLTDAFSAETVRTSISLARQLGLRIVAEGIENEDVLKYVKSKGIDQAQGYLFSKPVPAADITRMFANPLSWIADSKLMKKSDAA